MELWDDPKHPSYLGKPTRTCLGCGKPVPMSAWGPWCHPCNSVRMRRINERFAPLAKAFGDDQK